MKNPSKIDDYCFYYMNTFYYSDLLEAGVDEVARGTLAGPVYTAAVVWPKDEGLDMITKDSKQYSKRQRLMLKDYIEEYAIDYSVSYETPECIDKINILQATMKSMHTSLRNLNMDVEHIIVDGTNFIPFKDSDGSIVPHSCVPKGDNKYLPVACASILAKVYHDQAIEKYCDDHPEQDIYDWRSNMCYGTKNHLDAIRKHGTSPYHRKTFGICREY